MTKPITDVRRTLMAQELVAFRYDHTLERVVRAWDDPQMIAPSLQSRAYQLVDHWTDHVLTAAPAQSVLPPADLADVYDIAGRLLAAMVGSVPEGDVYEADWTRWRAVCAEQAFALYREVVRSTGEGGR